VVYSQADREARHVQLADEAVCIGPPANRDSYLNIPNIMQAALNSGADAEHPGYGNLSEVAAFAECESQDRQSALLGRDPAHGGQASARDHAARQVPVIPGSEDGRRGGGSGRGGGRDRLR
jgi:acetyl-CoA carboxylase biotin carboxylase subunit